MRIVTANQAKFRSGQTTDDLGELVKAYKRANTDADRLRLAEAVICRIGPDLGHYMFSNVSPDTGKDALQETLTKIALNLRKFEWHSEEEFWSWCYRICRNEITNHQRLSQRVEPLPPEEIQELIELSSHADPISTGTRIDLEQIMKLLRHFKQECYDLLWNYYVFGFTYREIAVQQALSYDNVRMKIGRCLQQAHSFVS